MTRKISITVNDEQAEFLFYIEEIFCTSRSRFIKTAIETNLSEIGWFPKEELKETIANLEKEATYDLGWRFSVTITNYYYSVLEFLSERHNIPISTIARLCLDWHIQDINDYMT